MHIKKLLSRKLELLLEIDMPLRKVVGKLPRYVSRVRSFSWHLYMQVGAKREGRIANVCPQAAAIRFYIYITR